MIRGICMTGVALVAGVALTACSDSAAETAPTPSAPSQAPTDAPSGEAFYAGPTQDLASYEHGDLGWSTPYAGSLPDGAESATLVLYAQNGINYDTVWTSGVVYLPQGTAPESGWPVVTWGHGTTGIADQCAPSRLNSDYEDLVATAWLEQGYAVTRTDYEGLGTVGDHPYLIGPSEGRSMLDAVRAAQQLSSAISDEVVIAGHSQGAHAALWASSFAPAYTPELEVKATVAFAPPSHLTQVVDAIASSTAEAPTSLVALALRGMQIGSPDTVMPDQILTKKALAAYPTTLTTCASDLGGPDAFGKVSASSLIAPGADFTAVKAELDENDPSRAEPTGPALILQGGKDQVVLEMLTGFLVDSYQSRGLEVDYKTYPKADHGTVLTAGFKDALAFVADQF